MTDDMTTLMDEREQTDEAVQVQPNEEIAKSQCSVCGKWYSPKWLYSHQRKQHGIYGGVSGRGRKRGPRSKAVAKPESNGHAAKPKRSVELVPLTAEQITTAAAQALWEAGVPYDHLPSLLRWNNHTVNFLTEVQQ